ncbi:MAG: hypothetical protein KGR26_12230, partial [Cyanobacteria bacterium REEB65]|nr:hypothetical protein [Cyanobacteria bacterium REEB65]
MIGNAGSGLIGNSGSGLIGNAGAGLAAYPEAGPFGTFGVPIEAIQDVASPSYTEEPLTNALVYLTDPQDHFLSLSDGSVISTTTDASGDFVFPARVKVNTQTIVNIILPGNRREVGYSLPSAGENEVDVSVPSTYVTEFLRLRSLQDGKAMSDYPGGLSALPGLTDLTRKALVASALPFVPGATGSLNIGNIVGTLDRQYALAVGTNQDGLGDAWASFLGYRTHALETVVGTGQDGIGGSGVATEVTITTPKGLARTADGTLYIAENHANFIRGVFPDGTTKVIAGSAAGTAGTQGDGGPATAATIYKPDGVAIGDDGNLYICGADYIRVVALGATPSPWVTAPWTIGNIYSVLEASGIGDQDGSLASAQAIEPEEMVFDRAGNLYFIEGVTKQVGTAAWNHVRVLTPPTAQTQTLYGTACPPGAVTTLAGAPMTEGFS